MGCASSREQQPRVVGWWSRYEEFAQALKNDPYRDPTPDEKRRISEYQPREFEPTDDSKPPLLFLAKDSEEWFGCLIEKCDPTVMWIGADGQRKGLDAWLMGKSATCARNFTVWSTKIDEWKREHPAFIVTTRTGPPPTRGQDFWTPELGKLALALGIGAAAGFAGIPAAAVGSGIWMVMHKWHTSFSTEIGATGFGAQELQELQQLFEGCAVQLGRFITLLGTRIEEIDANNLDAQAEERRGNLQARVDTLRCFLDDDIAEMDRITRRRSTSQREKKRSMMTKLRSLWDLCTTEEALCTTQEVRDTTREMMLRMPSQQQLPDGNAMPPTRCFPQRSLSTFSTPGQRSAFGAASSFDGESASDPPVPFDA